jgi:hypothetical protein
MRPAGILAAGLVLVGLAGAFVADMEGRRFNGHIRGCSCDTCCVLYLEPDPGATGPNYAAPWLDGGEVTK